MSDAAQQPRLHCRFWRERAAPDQPYSAEEQRCLGYDVHADLMRHASYLDYLGLLLLERRLSGAEHRRLEVLAMALANPGPRDPSVHAAMCGGATGGSAAAALIAALGAGAGGQGGARELRLCLQRMRDCGRDLPAWHSALRGEAPGAEGCWPALDAQPGFDAWVSTTPRPVLLVLEALAETAPAGQAAWLREQLSALEQAAAGRLNLLGACSAGMHDLGLDPARAEMLTLLLRLPGAAAHALEQAERGFRDFPFFGLRLLDDPASEDKAS